MRKKKKKKKKQGRSIVAAVPVGLVMLLLACCYTGSWRCAVHSSWVVCSLRLAPMHCCILDVLSYLVLEHRRSIILYLLALSGLNFVMLCCASQIWKCRTGLVRYGNVVLWWLNMVILYWAGQIG